MLYAKWIMDLNEEGARHALGSKEMYWLVDFENTAGY